MTPGSVSGTLSTFSKSVSTTMNSTNIPSASRHSQTNALNQSAPEGCVHISLDKMVFVPWANHDNIVNEEVEMSARTVRFSTMFIFFLIGGPANAINMAVFFKQGLRDRVNLLLFSLSLADVFYLVMSIMVYGDEIEMYLSREKKLGPVFIFVMHNYLSGFMAVAFVSFVLSGIIACERCYCVLRPLKYQTMMRTKTMAFVIVAVYAIVLGLYFVVVIRYHTECVYDPSTGIVTDRASHSEFYKRHKALVDNVDNVLFGAGLPVGLMVVTVTTTTITAAKLRQIVAWRTKASSSMSAKEVALTKMLIGTSVLLTVCISPSCVLRVVCLFQPELNTGRRFHNFYLTCFWITQVFLHVNCSCNIFIYYAMGSRYRETFWVLFKRE